MVLVAEDEPAARLSLTELLEGAGYSVIPAGDGTNAFAALMEAKVDAALLDIRMPGMDGLTVLRRVRESGLAVPIIVMTAHGDSATVIEAMRLGAYDYISKPLDFEHLKTQLERAVAHHRVAQNQQRGTDDLKHAADDASMVGYSPTMQHVYKLIGQVAATDATILVRGESGTGKELVVNAIHYNSVRAKGPLVKVNCAAIPETLLESELFGHEKGAFTNAMFRRVGRFEEAADGTLFLDEVGDLAHPLQSKLLRAIQERTVERLGSNTPTRVDLRLIAATSRDLEEEVAQGRFREDLYYRLNVVTIELPPLRARRQDIPSLVQHFLRRGARQLAITPEALNMLCEYHWPGNVRELENTIERAVVLARAPVLDVSDIDLRHRPRTPCSTWTDQIPLHAGWKANLAAIEKAMITRALREADGNKSKAADMLGMHRRLLYEKMREHGVNDGAS
jgi:DNA-binding NtrC family response regulator